MTHPDVSLLDEEDMPKVKTQKPPIYQDPRNRLIKAPFLGPKIGVELELEFDGFDPFVSPKLTNDPSFMLVKDGSLRNIGAEFVFRPGSVKTMTKRIDSLLAGINHEMASAGSIVTTHRTSSHVHMNVSDMPYIDILSMVTTWALIEEFIFQECGPSRIGNNFCLRFIDASHTAKSFSNFAKRMANPFNKESTLVMLPLFFSKENHKYSACNPAPLIGQGTLEFRLFPGVTKENKMLFFEFLYQLEHLRKVASTFESPEHVLELYDGLPELLYQRVLTPYFYNRCLSARDKLQVVTSWEAEDIAAIIGGACKWPTRDDLFNSKANEQPSIKGEPPSVQP